MFCPSNFIQNIKDCSTFTAPKWHQVPFPPHALPVSHGAGCLVERRCPAPGGKFSPKLTSHSSWCSPGVQREVLRVPGPFLCCRPLSQGRAAVFGGDPQAGSCAYWKLREGNAANPGPEGELTVLSLLKGVRWDPELPLGPLQALSPVPVLEC